MAYVWLMADIPYYAVKQFTVHTSGICTSMTYVLLMAEKRKILRTMKSNHLFAVHLRNLFINGICVADGGET